MTLREFLVSYADYRNKIQAIICHRRGICNHGWIVEGTFRYIRENVPWFFMGFSCIAWGI